MRANVAFEVNAIGSGRVYNALSAARLMIDGGSTRKLCAGALDPFSFSVDDVFGAAVEDAVDWAVLVVDVVVERSLGAIDTSVLVVSRSASDLD